MKKGKKKANIKIIGFAGIGLFGLGLALSTIGLTNTIAKIDESVIAGEPEAILASSGVEKGTNIGLPVTFFDQKADPCVNIYDSGASIAVRERQFEWTSCDYHTQRLEQGMVGYQLNSDYLPDGVGGELLSNRGMADLSRWFNNVDGKSKEYIGNLDLTYGGVDGVEFRYTNGEFYPLDTIDFSNGDAVNDDGHNHLFTMNMVIPFAVMADGNEEFEIATDDDTFVYVGDKLAIDLGGIHDVMHGKFAIRDNGDVYAGVNNDDLAYTGINLADKDEAAIRIFHADRDSRNSVFDLRLVGFNLNLVHGQLASGDGVQVAFDPANPSYIGPLGESMRVRPNMTKAQIIIATTMAALAVVCVVFMVGMIRLMIKNKR